MSYISLHQHTVYSLLDGFCKIPELISRAKELGMTACAITDHNHLGGIPEFQAECFKQKIKPILGLEGYFTKDMSQLSKSLDERKNDAKLKLFESGEFTEETFEKLKSKEKNMVLEKIIYDTHSYHILFLAKNQKGWKNLVKLQSESARLCTFNGRFHCDTNLIRKYSEGLICTCACIGSYPSKMIQVENFSEAENYIREMKEIFGENFFLEIQPLNIREQILTNIFYLSMAEKYSLKCIATNDVHYVYENDFEDHDTLLCIGIGKFKDDTERMRYSHDFWLRSESEMIQAFEKQLESVENVDADKYRKFFSDALETSGKVAEEIDADIEIGSEKPLFPKVKVPNDFSAEDFLTLTAFKGLYKYLSSHPECNKSEYERQLNYELEIINSKGFAPYILTVHEFISWAKKNNILVGPGRGSAAGSLCLFSIGITQHIDPIKNKLMFSRFLTKDRTALPDIDVDFSYYERDDVIHHLEEYYGKNCVSHIGTYSEIGVKSGIKDVARVLKIDFKISNEITKQIDEINNSPGLTFKMLDEMKVSEDQNDVAKWKKFNELENRHKEIFRLARRFEGIPRNTGVHASGILVTPMSVNEKFPLCYDKQGTAITLWTGTQLEEFQAVKLDLLGLKTLSVIQKTLLHINPNHKIEDLYEAADLNDEKVFKFISEGKTDAVFQLSSDIMKTIIKDIKPTEFNDIVAINAAARPGPLKAGFPKLYADTKNGKIPPQYPIRNCEDILSETHGVILYQEQLMQISKKISGFDDSQADSITRKITAKKKKEMFPMMIRCHIYGKKNCEGFQGWEDDENSVWYDPKGKYGGEIKGALANGYSVEEVKNYFDKISGYSSYAFNKSHAASYSYISYLCAWLKFYYPVEFMAAILSMADEDKRVEYIKVLDAMNITLKAPDINISEKDFTPQGKNILYGTASIKSVGEIALKEILKNRPYTSLEDCFNRLPKKAFNKRIGTALIKAGAFDGFNKNRYELLNIFHELRKDKVEKFNPDDYDENICIEMERETLGTFVTYKPWWETVEENKTVNFQCQIEEISERLDKNKNLMAFLKLKTQNCLIDAICFSSVYAKINDIFKVGKILIFEGKKDSRGNFIIKDLT